MGGYLMSPAFFTPATHICGRQQDKTPEISEIHYRFPLALESQI
jgi:hypothetical protein